MFIFTFLFDSFYKGQFFRGLVIKRQLILFSVFCIKMQYGVQVIQVNELFYYTDKHNFH